MPRPPPPPGGNRVHPAHAAVHTFGSAAEAVASSDSPPGGNRVHPAHAASRKFRSAAKAVASSDSALRPIRTQSWVAQSRALEAESALAGKRFLYFKRLIPAFFEGWTAHGFNHLTERGAHRLDKGRTMVWAALLLTGAALTAVMFDRSISQVRTAARALCSSPRLTARAVSAEQR